MKYLHPVFYEWTFQGTFKRKFLTVMINNNEFHGTELDMFIST